MIPKPGKDMSTETNYRPISLLSTMGKLFEKILVKRLQIHFRETKFFNKWQRAYLPGQETNEIIHRLVEETRAAKIFGSNNKWTTTAFSLDVEKAFD